MVIEPQVPQAEAVAPVALEHGELLLAVTRVVNDNFELLEECLDNKDKNS